MRTTFLFIKNQELLLFSLLTDILVVDNPLCVYRHQVVYSVLSVKYNSRLQINLYIQELATLSSLGYIYSSSVWLEREVFDMNGVIFLNHLDLRRILTDYGFEGYPLRKDFPLTGFIESRYDDSQKRVIIELIELAQEYRSFYFNNPWCTTIINIYK